MTRPARSRRRRLLVLLLVPPLLWSLALLLAPTEWARARLERRLAEATGHRVQIGRLSLGPLGGVRLRTLAIADPGQPAAPWLKVARLRVDLSLLQLALGRLEPSRVHVEGIDLLVRRRPDGSLELADLIAPTAPTAAAPPVCTILGDCGAPRTVAVTVAGGRIRVDDRAGDNRLLVDRIEGRGTWRADRVEVTELHGRLNGGRLALNARLDCGGPPAFEGQLRAEGVALQSDCRAVAYLLPLLRGVPSVVEDRLDLNLYLRGHGATVAEVRRSLVGQGSLAVDPVRLEGSRLLGELERLVPLPEDGRIGAVRSTFTIEARRVSTPDLTIELGGLPIVLTGWSDFDGRLAYAVKSEALTGRLGAEARRVLADLPVPLERLVDIRLVGTFDTPRLTLDGVALTGAGDDRERLRSLGRRLRDRLFR